VLAKQAASVNAIALRADVGTNSGGRLILGLGVGWHRPEFDAFGIPFDHTISRFAEALQIADPLPLPAYTPTSARVSSPAGSSAQPLVFCPAQRGEKSPLPCCSAAARSGATAIAASGKDGARALIGPSSRISRFTMPRAGLGAS
jgi:alkanesulfonate monooxygenase SsuD/methylene tetrahydromethanopterin reductase-like flavin-dependent oxidoreductase (luciferase family)